MKVKSAILFASLAAVAKSVEQSAVDVVHVENEDGPIMRGILDPIDWVSLGGEALDKKMEFLSLPDLGLGCSEFNEKVNDGHYNFYKFKQCVWTPVRDLPNYNTIIPTTDSVKPLINEHISFPFFGVIQKAPSIWSVSSNGYVQIIPGNGATRSNPNIAEDQFPYNIISPLFSCLRRFRPANRIRYGNFRIGDKVLCTKIEWFLTPCGTEQSLRVQLDICSNGIFTQRVKEANLKAQSQVGLNFGGKDTVFKYSALPKTPRETFLIPYSAIVMRPADKIFKY